MSGRRMPLSSNQNVVNSPLRASQAARDAAAKHKRAMTSMTQEDNYGQPPPAKKQMLESGVPRSVKSPSKLPQPRVPKTSTLSLQQGRRNANSYESKLARERSGNHLNNQPRVVDATDAKPKYTEAERHEIRSWQKSTRARFPQYVFYFENLPNDIQRGLSKQVANLGAREEKFFSIGITHVVTTRSIPSVDSVRQRQQAANAENVDSPTDEEQGQQEQQTIDPHLLNRMPESASSTKKPFSSTAIPGRRPLSQLQDARPKRNMDVLFRAREMGKRIWSVEKIQKILSMVFDQEAANGSTNVSAPMAPRSVEERPDLLKLLHNERVNGHSDRDLSVRNQELQYFKGPYLYIYDYEEKQKPIMVREYKKVNDKIDGDWPQFRTAAIGRCPFIEDDHREIKTKPKTQAKPVIEPKPVLQPPEVQPPKPVTGKRSLGEMESAHNRGSSVASTEFVQPSRPSSMSGKSFDFRPNAFTSRAASAKLFGGEPVASGVQQSNVTSAIRSQMISSTAATPGAIGVLSKEVHGLQRKVLQRNSSHDLSSRRNGSVDMGTSFRDEASTKRPATLGRTSSRRLEFIDEVLAGETQAEAKAASQAEKTVVAEQKKKKRELKPGYCENCQDKFEDFDEHIATRKHRKFADNPDNWADLDNLLSELERVPKHKAVSTWSPTSSMHTP